MPKLAVCPLERIRPHEEVDPLRVARLAERIGQEGAQLNPVVCVQRPNDDLVLLDGATRVEALRRLGVGHAVVQVVQPESVLLETWNHVVRDTTPEAVLQSIEDQEDLELDKDYGAPRVWTPDRERRTVEGGDISPNQALSRLVAAYVGRWRVNRVIDTDLETLGWRFPDWVALIEFPPLTVEDVANAALTFDLLPAGVTRFVVPDRALRLNTSLDLLKETMPIEERQRRLDEILAERAHQGRIRRYEEPVVILDD